MQGVDTRDLEDFDRSLESLLKEFPQMRRVLHQGLADEAMDAVGSAMSQSGLSNNGGRVRRWQVKQVGSGGGYAAVHPQPGKLSANTKGIEYAYGQITNAVEGGHTIRKPSGAKGYRPRIRVAYVNGYHFYQTAKGDFEARAIRMAEAFADQLAERLEAGG